MIAVLQSGIIIIRGRIKFHCKNILKIPVKFMLIKVYCNNTKGREVKIFFFVATYPRKISLLMTTKTNILYIPLKRY